MRNEYTRVRSRGGLEKKKNEGHQISRDSREMEAREGQMEQVDGALRGISV